MKKYGFILVLVGLVGILLAVFAIGNKPTPAKPDSQLLGTKYPELARDHIQPGTKTPVPYNSNPPSSGPHYYDNDCPAKWGTIDPSPVQPDECYIHNLEHGGIWITYRPDLPQDQIDKLKQIVQSLPPDSQFNEQKVIMTPRAANDQAISLAAWTYVYSLSQPDEAKIKQFYQDHVNKGPELTM